MVIIGIDEVGRGCWAGPLVAGAVILDDTRVIPGLTDSKLLTPAKRYLLAAEIHTKAAAIGLGWVTSREVDKFGLTLAVSLAMQRAIAKVADICTVEHIAYDEIIIDGNYNYLRGYDSVRTLVKADLFIPAVSAASIVAKVARDTWMANIAATEYPAYGFERHMGYGTKRHLQAIQSYGICELHRKSFKPVKVFC